MTPRRALVAAALAAAVLLPPAPAAGEEGAPEPPPRRSPAFQAAVDGAIARGVPWLRSRQLPDGSWDVRPIPMYHVEAAGSLGPTALALYTLRACGVPREDPDVRRGFQRLRERYDSLRKRTRGLDNYGVSLTVLALEAHHAAPETAVPGDRTGAGAAEARRIPEADLDWMRELVRWLVQAQVRNGAFSYWSPAQGPAWDLSNTQFSLLALKAARRCGVEVPAEVWRRSLDHLLETQERRGPAVGRFAPAEAEGEGYAPPPLREVAKDAARGWGYVHRAPATGSMTAGGVSSLVICRSELRGTRIYDEALDRKVVQAVRDGLAWLGAAFSVEENPGPPGAPAMKETWHHYWLYGLERAGVLSGVARVERRDWYLEGAVFLLDSQRDDGSWLSREALDGSPWKGAGPDGPTANFLDTCFALLFLKRATFRVESGAVATEAGTERLRLEGAADLDDGAFRNLFDAVLLRYRAAPAADRGARAVDFVRLGPRALPLLILRLDAAEEAARGEAFAILRGTTGEGRGYDPGAPAEARAAAVADWEAWWFARKGVLEADPAAGRFRERPPGPPAEPR